MLKNLIVSHDIEELVGEGNSIPFHFLDARSNGAGDLRTVVATFVEHVATVGIYPAPEEQFDGLPLAAAVIENKPATLRREFCAEFVVIHGGECSALVRRMKLRRGFVGSGSSAYLDSDAAIFTNQPHGAMYPRQW